MTPPSVIPFVTRASPFVAPQHPRSLQQQQSSKQSYLLQRHQQPSPTAFEDGCQPFLPFPTELTLPGPPRLSSSSEQWTQPPTVGVLTQTTTAATADLPSSSSFARTTLPPFSCIVPESLAAPGEPTVFPTLQSAGGVRRPMNAPRPGTAPAAYLSNQHTFRRSQR